MDRPRMYLIKVRGAVPSDWSHRLGGMKIVPGTDTDGEPITVFKGELRDQAALAGVLDTLFQYHLAILNVSQEEVRGGSES